MMVASRAAQRLRQNGVPLVVGGAALGVVLALLASAVRASSQEFALGLALLLAALTGIAKTTTA